MADIERFAARTVRKVHADHAGGRDAGPTAQVAPQVRQLPEALANADAVALSRSDLQARMGLQDRKSFRERYLGPALDAGLVTMTLADRPSSRSQQYRLTELGRACIEAG